MIATSNLIKTPKVVTINQNRWSRSVKFTGHDLLEWVVTVDQNTHKCLNALPFPQAMGLVSDALFASQWVAAPSEAGTLALQLEYDLEGLSLEVEEAYLAWRRSKTLEARRLYDRLSDEFSKAQKELQETKGTSTEVLATMEEQALRRASKEGKIIGALGSVVTSASMNVDCTELTIRTISGKTVTVYVNGVSP